MVHIAKHNQLSAGLEMAFSDHASQQTNVWKAAQSLMFPRYLHFERSHSLDG